MVHLFYWSEINFLESLHVTCAPTPKKDGKAEKDMSEKMTWCSELVVLMVHVRGTKRRIPGYRPLADSLVRSWTFIIGLLNIPSLSANSIGFFVLPYGYLSPANQSSLPVALEVPGILPPSNVNTTTQQVLCL
jgi:hypothetical protein